LGGKTVRLWFELDELCEYATYYATPPPEGKATGSIPLIGSEIVCKAKRSLIGQASTSSTIESDTSGTAATPRSGGGSKTAGRQVEPYEIDIKTKANKK